LAKWFIQIRAGRVNLTNEQKRVLEDDLGFTYKSNPQIKFEDYLERLKKYKMEHGDCKVPYGYKPDIKLAEWVKHVRSGTLKVAQEKENRKKLREIGFHWESAQNRYDREWKAMFQRLEAYKERFGDVRVPWNWKEDRQLSDWVHTQRRRRVKKGEASFNPYRWKLLNEIGFVWEPMKSMAEARQAKLAIKATQAAQKPAAEEDEEDREAADILVAQASTTPAAASVVALERPIVQPLVPPAVNVEIVPPTAVAPNAVMNEIPLDNRTVDALNAYMANVLR